MNLLVLLWIVLSIVLVGLFVWTNLPLIDQKKAWKNFASKNNLKYFPNGFLKSPFVIHEGDDSTFRLFSEEQNTDDLTRRRFTTVFEWVLPGLPIQGLVASRNMQELVLLADVKDRIVHPPGEWKSKDFIIAEKADALMPYLTEQRMAFFRKMVSMKNARFIYVFDGNMAVLRVETHDPLLSDTKITPVYKKVQDNVKILFASEEERKEMRKLNETKQEVETQEGESDQSDEAAIDAENVETDNQAKKKKAKNPAKKAASKSPNKSSNKSSKKDS